MAQCFVCGAKPKSYSSNVEYPKRYLDFANLSLGMSPNMLMFRHTVYIMFSALDHSHSFRDTA